MKAAGVICEFNPFHKGHKYLIDSVRAELSPDAVVCVMSGDFVQRGAPAVCGKFLRAQAALACGADLVIELPVYFAVAAAPVFAEGGVRMLRALGCVEHLAFGSESGNAGKLMESADILSRESQAFKSVLEAGLSEGMPYASAYSLAAEAAGLDIDTISGANDMLAVEYLKQILLQNAAMEPFAVKRVGTAHDLPPREGYASASWIREQLAHEENGLAAVDSYLPEASARLLRRGPVADKATENRYYELIRYMLIKDGSKAIRNVPEAGEGLDNRIARFAAGCTDLNGLILSAKSKRYTYARISRCLCQMLLGLDRDILSEARARGLAYAKVLAFNEKGAGVLKVASKAGTLVISNVNKVPEDEPRRLLLDADIRASDIYSLISGRDVSSCSDRVTVPGIENNK